MNFLDEEEFITWCRANKVTLYRVAGHRYAPRGGQRCFVCGERFRPEGPCVVYRRAQGKHVFLRAHRSCAREFRHRLLDDVELLERRMESEVSRPTKAKDVLESLKEDR